MAWVRADKPVNPKKDHYFLGLRSDRHLPRGPIGPWGDVVDDVFHRTLPENTVNITMMTVTTSMLVRCLPCLSRCFLGAQHTAYITLFSLPLRNCVAGSHCDPQEHYSGEDRVYTQQSRDSTLRSNVNKDIPWNTPQQSRNQVCEQNNPLSVWTLHRSTLQAQQNTTEQDLACGPPVSNL